MVKLFECDSFFPVRKYVQLNDLVIDNYDMLKTADLSGGFKYHSTEYSFGHGSYTNFRSEQAFSKEQQVSLTLKLDYRKLSREQRTHYLDWLHYNITRHGKIWAIEGDTLLWAYCYVDDFSKPYLYEKYKCEIDVDLVLWEGIWHKADGRRTFLKPYAACDFLECLNLKAIDECTGCLDADCLSCLGKQDHEDCESCYCHEAYFTKEHALCSLKKEIANVFYKQCGDSYQILTNCSVGNKLWGEESMLGTKICKKESCKPLIAGRFYSNTVLSTGNVTITIIGVINNPIITINDNTMEIDGSFDGILTLTPSGEVYFAEDFKCKPKLLPVETVKIPHGNTFGFTIHQGENRIIIDTQDCCKMTCVYLDFERITI